jgi:hypothetical protein
MTQRAFGHTRPGHAGQPLNYADTSTAYRLDDVPVHARTAKQQILHFLDPDILKRKKQPWNSMTTPAGPYPDDHGPMNKGMPFAPRFPDPSLKRSLHVGTSTRAEIDQRAEKIPKRDPIMPRKTSKLQFDPRRLNNASLPSNLGGTAPAQQRMDTTLPPGRELATTTRFVVDVDPTGNLDMKEGWNPSVQQDQKWRVVNYNQELEKALQNTQHRAMKLTKKRTSLIDTYKKSRADQREEKKINALKEGDFESYLEAVEKLKAKPEFAAAEAARQKELDRMEIFYSNDWRTKDYYCDGVWRLDPIEGRHCWSCCGSFQRDGPGCQPRKRSGTGWNFASIP